MQPLDEVWPACVPVEPVQPEDEVCVCGGGMHCGRSDALCHASTLSGAHVEHACTSNGAYPKNGSCALMGDALCREYTSQRTTTLQKRQAVWHAANRVAMHVSCTLPWMRFAKDALRNVAKCIGQLLCPERHAVGQAAGNQKHAVGQAAGNQKHAVGQAVGNQKACRRASSWQPKGMRWGRRLATKSMWSGKRLATKLCRWLEAA
eukprot:356244-Chlamydomonas_euryale.AAC.5